VIYCVIPRELEGDLFERMVAYYEDNPNVTVIVDRREFDRRARYGRSSAADAGGGTQRRVIRDRRRARVAGDLLPLAHAS
jgi:hypothetical protein